MRFFFLNEYLSRGRKESTGRKQWSLALQGAVCIVHRAGQGLSGEKYRISVPVLISFTAQGLSFTPVYTVPWHNLWKIIGTHWIFVKCMSEPSMENNLSALDLPKG